MEGGIISLKKYKKYSRSGNKREIREIVSEEVDKVERTRKPRNGSRKKVAPTSSVNKTEGVFDLNKYRVKSKIAVKLGVNRYLCLDCIEPNGVKITNSDEATLFRSDDMAKEICKNKNINNYTLEEL